MSIGEQEVFVLSERALSDVIDQVQDHQWNQMTPGWFQSGRQGNVSLRGIVHDHAYDWAWVPHVLAGKTMAEVGGAYDGHLLGADPKGSSRRSSEQALAAILQLDDPEKLVHLPSGNFPAREYLGLVGRDPGREQNAEKSGSLFFLDGHLKGCVAPPLKLIKKEYMLHLIKGKTRAKCTRF